MEQNNSMQPPRQLSLFDSICILVGIIIGTGIYETSPAIAASMGGTNATLSVWIVGGLLSLTGSLCYAELATAYPRAGGDYVYLTRAFGPLCGALFGWSQLAIVRPGNIALMAFVFARYANQLWAPFGEHQVVWAVLIVLVLTAINIIGVRSGRTAQNVLTIAKVVSLVAIMSAAIWGGPAAATATTSPLPTQGISDLKLALILVLFTYGGWNEMAYVAAEVKNPRRNIVRALILGTLVVTVLYVLVNAAFFFGMGYEAMSKSQAVAVDAVTRALPAGWAGRAIAAVICISAAGAVNGMILTGARISAALGADHAMFRAIGRWNPRLGTPVGALVLQGSISLAILLAARSFVNAIIYDAPVVWLFFSATALSLFVLRLKERQTERPFKVPAFPLVPAIFLASSLFMLYNSITYAWSYLPKALWLMVGVLLIGLPVYFASRQIERHGASSRRT